PVDEQRDRDDDQGEGQQAPADVLADGPPDEVSRECPSAGRRSLIEVADLGVVAVGGHWQRRGVHVVRRYLTCGGPIRRRGSIGGVHFSGGIFTITGPRGPSLMSGTISSLAISLIVSSRASARPFTTTIASSAMLMPTCWYVAGKNSTSIDPSRSSSTACAHGA